MKIAVLGAGAVGCYYGGLLARAGHEVTLIGRPQHVEAIRRDGLDMDTRSFHETVVLQACTDIDGVRGAQLILCCVKSQDTEESARELSAHLDADAVILSMQNGVDNAERLSRILGRQVIPVAVYVATEMFGPGRVRHHGRGELVIGASPDSTTLAPLFSGAGIPVEISDNVVGALWAKLVLNCAFNALSAITQLPYRRLMDAEGVQQVMTDAVAECLTVARAEGVLVPGDTWAAVQRIARTVPDQMSSTAQDLARGKRSEIDYINGHVLRRGEALGIPTPVNRTLHTIVKLLESKSI
jgi:2-dehydropantoate 2-reductase